MTIKPQTSPSPATQRHELLREVLYHAVAYDERCALVDDRLEKLTEWGGNPERFDEAIASMQMEIADLHARIAPVAIAWVAEMPAFTVDAILDGDTGEVLEEIMPRLFDRAGIAERYRPIPQPAEVPA